MTRLVHRITALSRFFHIESWLRLILLCVLTGIVSGLGAVAFDRGLNALSRVMLFQWLFRLQPPDYWLLMVVPAAGALLGGILAAVFAPEATGHGTDSVIRAFHRNHGLIRSRVPLVKGICSILTIGSGGSAGKEGPIAQIGAGFGSVIGSAMRLSVYDRRILMLGGVAAGIGAIFKAPLGGALFAAEVLYREPQFEHDAVIPCVISSVIAYAMFTAVEGQRRILEFTNTVGLSFPSAGGSAFELLHYGMLSVCCALVAYLFVKGLHVIENKVFKWLPVPRVVKPALGGIGVGLVAIGLISLTLTVSVPSHQTVGGSNPSHIMSGGYEFLQSVLDSALDTKVIDGSTSIKLAAFLGLVLAGKILATALTTGSGGSGGLLFPALFLGGITGATYSKFLRALHDFGWLPDSLAMTPHARGSMILVGMGGVFAACTKTPIASLIMVCEITGSYGLLVPLMLTCCSAYLLSRSFSMNNEQVGRIADSPAHKGEFLVNVLEDLTVANALSDKAAPTLIPEDMPFPEVVKRIKESMATVFPVVDGEGNLTGIFSLSDIRQIMAEPTIGSLVRAGELGASDVVTVTVQTTLYDALQKLTQKNVDELPVVENAAAPDGSARTLPARVVAMLSRRDLIAAYHQRLLKMQSDEAETAQHILKPKA